MSKIIVSPTDGFERLNDVRAKIEANVDMLSAQLNAFPKNANGLTIESIRMSQGYKNLKASCDTAFKDLQMINRMIVKYYKKENYDWLIGRRLAKTSHKAL